MAGRRLTVVWAGFLLAAIVLAGRLIQLQSVDGAGLASRADRQQFSVESIPARPGDIVDRHGRLLAVTIRESSLYAVPNQIDRPREFADRLATVLAIDSVRLEAALHRDRKKSFRWIARRLSDEQAEAIRQLDLPVETWGLRHEYRRHYPHGTLAAHLVGLRDIDNVGRGGIEERFDAELRGTDGRRVIRRDALGRVIDIPDSHATSATPGQTIVLSIDSVIQHEAEAALDDLMATHTPRSACAIVMSVPEAEILAMASRPTFDPNLPGDATDDAWTNRAIASVDEPGSTLKPLVVAWAIDTGALQRDEEIDCELGVYRMGGRVLHDHHGYGTLSVTDVLVKSSNIGMAKIGERLGRDRLHECLVAFGFGRTTGIQLPGERAGVVRPPGDWNTFSIGSVPMGHEIAVTPLQLINAYAALTGDGRLRQPTLVRRGVTRPLSAAAKRESVRSPTVTSPVLNETVARWVVAEPMADVVRRGTGRAAAIDGYDVFGKTGTAQKFDAATGTFSHDRHLVSFVGGAPVDQPQVVVLVVADEPTGEAQSGGTVAAPAVAAILGRTLRRLGIPPGDRPSADRAIDRLVDESPQAFR